MSVGSVLRIVIQRYNLLIILQKMYGFLDVKMKDFSMLLQGGTFEYSFMS
jgi:hypothetical protein